MRRIFKIGAWLLGVILLLLLLVFLAPHVPVVQKKLVTSAKKFYRNKTGHEVEVGKIYFWPDGTVVLKDIVLPDDHGKIFIKAHEVRADIQIRSLLKGDFILSTSEVDSGEVAIEHRPDGSFNFTFLVDAFSGKSSSSSKSVFSIQRVFLENSSFSFADRNNGQFIKAYVKCLSTRFSAFDAEEQIFRVNELDIVGGDGYFIDLGGKKSIVKSDKDTSDDKLPDVYFNKINVYDTHYIVYLKEQGITVSSYAGELHGTTQSFDLNNSLIDFDELVLKNSGSYVRMSNVVDKQTNNENSDNLSEIDWIVRSDKLQMVNSWFRFDDRHDTIYRKGFDAAHFTLSHVNLEATNVVSKGSEAMANIRSGNLTSSDGYRIKSISGDFRVNEERISALGFRVQTNWSRISGDVITRQKSYSSFSTDLAGVSYYVNLAPSTLSPNDLVYFSHTLDSIPVIRDNHDLTAQLSGRVEGSLESFKLTDFSASAFGSSVKLSGSISNLDSLDKIGYDLALEKVYVKKSTIEKFVADTLLPPSIDLPEEITISGSLAGNLNNYNVDLRVNSSDGAVEAKGTLDRKGPLDLAAQVDSLRLGKIIGKPSTIGALSGNITASLNSIKPDSAIGKIVVSLSSIGMKGYNYHNVNADVNLDRGTVSGKLDIHDPNARLTASGKGRIKDKEIHADLNANLDTLDLFALGVSADTLSLKGHAEVSYKGKNPDELTVSGKASKLMIRQDKDAVHPDSLVFSLNSREGKIDFDISSTLVDATINGTGKLSTLPGDLTSYFNSYFRINGNAPERRDSSHTLDFKIHLKNPSEIISLFNPFLEISPVKLEGRYNGVANEFVTQGMIKNFNFKGNSVDSIMFMVTGDTYQLASEIKTPKIVSKGMIFPNPSVSIAVRHDSLSYSLSVKGNDNTERIRIGGLVERLENSFRFSVKPGEFVLNDTSWTVKPGNSIVFDSTGFIIKDFLITHKDQLLAVDEKENDRITITAKDFELMDLSMIADSNRIVAGGKLTGEITLPGRGSKDLSGNLTIRNFNYKKDTLGDIGVAFQEEEDNKLGFTATIDGAGNAIKAEGTYDFSDPYAPLKVKSDMAQINLETMQAFLGPVFEKMKGTAKANLTIGGTPEFPLIDGDINMIDVSLLPKYTHSWVRIIDQPIHVDQSSFLFRNFLITDSLNDPALVNGYICPEGISHITFDLLLVTSNFMVLNTKEGDNEQYFGRAFVTSITHITGDEINPIVNIDAKLNNGSRITLLVPEEKLRDSKADEIVSFVNPRIDSVRNQLRKKRIEPSFAGVSINSNIEVDEGSEFKLLLDPIAGDSLSVKGKTTFSFSLDPGGKMSMAGVYEVTEGSYLLTLSKGFKRRFDIMHGSKITWSGTPLNPDLNVTASYTVRAAPYDLVVNDFVARDEAASLAYRQEMPFLVNLSMAGNLTKPDVKFNVQLPEDQKGALEGTVYARLNQLNQNESELNTQVFSLLVLNRFYNNQEIMNYGGPLFSSYARTGVSRIISQRLNAFATTYAKFVELTLDVDFYETYNGTSIENATNVRIGVGRKLFSERLDIRAGGQVLLQSPEIPDRTSDFPSLVEAEYKLTRDGRYRLSGFRKNTYEGVFEGQIIREGAGIVFIRDFNRFGELFRKPEERDLLDVAPRPVK